MEERLDELYGVYCNLYNEQLEAAEPDYKEYFTSVFAPPDKPWSQPTRLLNNRAWGRRPLWVFSPGVRQ